MDDAALSAAKAAALASMPKFGGGSGGGGSAAAAGVPPAPPPKGLRRSSAAKGLDAEEVARRAQRASRFGGLPVPPSSGRDSPAPQPRPPSAAAGWASREGSAAPEGDEEDDGALG